MKTRIMSTLPSNFDAKKLWDKLIPLPKFRIGQKVRYKGGSKYYGIVKDRYLKQVGKDVNNRPKRVFIYLVEWYRKGEKPFKAFYWEDCLKGGR